LPPGDVGQGHRLQHGAHIGAERDPDVLQRRRGARVGELVGRSERMLAIGPSTVRITSAIVIVSASRAKR
jgi:hypothetical protein